MPMIGLTVTGLRCGPLVICSYEPFLCFLEKNPVKIRSNPSKPSVAEGRPQPDRAEQIKSG